jgi:F-type H+-transporting ATPase subunit gamma
MAGAGLIAIKRRIRSINNTKKITRAVGLVATSKLKKLRGILNLNNYYYEKLNSVMGELVKDDESHSNEYIKGNKSNNKLLIALTSDAGLCGGFNGGVVNKATEYLLKDKENSLLIIVGQKGRAYFKRLNVKSVAEFVDIPDVPTHREAEVIINKAMELFLKGEVGEISVMYTKFTSAVKQEVSIKKILPLHIENLEEDVDNFFEFEPKREEILKSVCQSYLNKTLLNLMLNSKTSEQSLRMAAMDGATSNADDLLEKLKLKYNRIRQSIITQEISEIVGGAEAQR